LGDGLLTYHTTTGPVEPEPLHYHKSITSLFKPVNGIGENCPTDFHLTIQAFSHEALDTI